jgi:hypothetical protein
MNGTRSILELLNSIKKWTLLNANDSHLFKITNVITVKIIFQNAEHNNS